ncbi:hypothetical protein [Amycolatopsis thailandensis]|uniref:hypothetical protein n=1 Tax=Amycolatopsis thailandensis TaxID=589330 RepID=UPI0011781A37|nr:hypothetical protein [Amycolatopsis thailandensis]
MREAVMSAPTTAVTPALTRREVKCRDAARRPRHVSTYVGEGVVVLLAPAAEAAQLDPDSARELATNLREHADAVEARQRTSAGAAQRTRF